MLSRLFALALFSVALLLAACTERPRGSAESALPTTPYIVVLGTVQDAGSPHIGCAKACCKDLFDIPDPTRKVVSLGLVDPKSGRTFLFEATPDMPSQIEFLNRFAKRGNNEMPDGIFLTHAHIGHYTGLMYFGREANSAKAVPVYAMPQMVNFLSTNGPWSQLVSLNNIALKPIKADSAISLSDEILVTALLVPHRDEYSETVGFIINGPTKSLLFIPDIDKWQKWERDIKQLVSEVDYALIDATFYSGEEINNRDISEIPHPFIIESMELFADMDSVDKAKVHFIHLNHTNPALDSASQATKQIRNNGFHLAHYGQVLAL
jgi:pyrroloquinoline quinone biosynthesis protein B